MKILILAARFWPLSTPRAHRWSKLAAAFAAAGHEVTVVTCRQKGQPDRSFFEGCEVRRTGHAGLAELFRFYFSSEKAAAEPPRRPSPLAAFAAFLHQNALKKLLFPDESAIWTRPARRLAEQILIEKGADALITVSMPFAAPMAGRRLKKARPRLFWLCDIGDPLALHDPDLSAKSPFFERINRRIERGVLAQSDAATVTNAATRDRFAAFFGDEIGSKILVAPPVFELEKAASEPTVLIEKAAGELHLGYFGAIYRPFRSPEAVLNWLEKTEKARPELARRLVVHFFGDIKPEFFEMLAASPRVRLHGQRPRAEAQRAMADMDFLINLGNRGDYLLPSKAAEYLASGRPVLHFSNAASDPFSQFFGGSRAFLAVLAEKENVSAADCERLWAALEGDRTGLSRAEAEAAVAPFRAENVARGILEILENGLENN